MKCRVCGTETGLLEVLKNKEKDVTTLYKTPFCGPKGEIELYRCPACTHMQIKWMNSKDYYKDYSLISDINENNGMGMYTESLLGYYRLKFSQLSSYAVSHDRIFDIGCGAGVLLDIEGEFFKETLGIEPSETQYKIAKNQGKKVINDYFSKELNLMPGFSAFVSTAVFEHIETIKESLEYAYEILEDGGVGLVEIPNGQKMYFEQSYYDIFSDHVNYFTPLSLATLANEIGFEVISISEEFNRNHLSLFVRKSFHPYISLEDAIYRDLTIINELLKDENSIGIWGIGAKARSFIQLIQDKNKIKGIWDVNALTWGKYLDSTDLQICAPSAEEVKKVNCILIFAAAYTQEIIDTLSREYKFSGSIIRFDGPIQREVI